MTNVDFFRDFAADTLVVSGKEAYKFSHDVDLFNYGSQHIKYDENYSIYIFHYTKPNNPLGHNSSGNLHEVNYSGAMMILQVDNARGTTDNQSGSYTTGLYETKVKPLIDAGGVVKEIADYNNCINSPVDLNLTNWSEVFTVKMGSLVGSGVWVEYTMRIENSWSPPTSYTLTSFTATNTTQTATADNLQTIIGTALDASGSYRFTIDANDTLPDGATLTKTSNNTFSISFDGTTPSQDYSFNIICSPIGNTSGNPRSVTITLSVSAVNSIYVSSINGDDSNNGFNKDNPKLTLQASASLLDDDYNLYLERGSHWNGESANIRILKENITVTTYGTGEKPIITGAEMCTTSKTGGYTNIYQSTHNFGNDDPTSTAGRQCIYENGVPLLAVQTMAEVDSTAGTFYYPYSDNASDGIDIIYFHPSDSGNPSTNGKTYFVNKYLGLRTLNFDFSNGDSSRGLLIEDVIQAYTWGPTQFLCEQDLVTLKRCVSIWGTKHNFHVGVESILEDCIAYGANDQKNISTGNTLFVTYAEDLDIKTRTSAYNRCIGINPITSYKCGNFIGHGQPSGFPLVITSDGSNTYGLEPFGGAVSNGHFDDMKNQANFNSLSNSLLSMIETPSWSIESVTMTDVTIKGILGARTSFNKYIYHNGVIAYQPTYTSTNFPTNGADIIHQSNTVIIGGNRNVYIKPTTDYQSDYMVYAKANGGFTGFIVGVSAAVTFIDWIDYTSQDINSVYISDLNQTVFLNDLDSGNIEINPNLEVWGKDPDTGLLTMYTGTFPDGTPLQDKIVPRVHNVYDFSSKITEMNTLVSNITTSIASM